ncbi:unnamed protein product [Bursaphelenchus okinawaensis]|uniref:Skp1-related protein n=1 Tax=Bursaphelenchus okinawaensis TaxID=465554 RepID=A0A811JZW0_9BILA|nr:unnamed protein product [Bursaphelenchus okinawaensis]CAG9088578.1 unnamed protein product [Bursaphelenchus okinawaensis]
MSNIVLQSNDDRTFNVDYAILRQSGMLSEMFKSLRFDESQGPEDPIPVPNVDGATLKKVIEFCDHHRDEPILEDPDSIEPHTFKLDDWQKEFMNVDDETLFNIIMAANYLDIRLLLEVGCKTVADKIKGKTPAELRVMFGVEGEFTPEDEEAVRKEMGWDKEVP